MEVITSLGNDKVKFWCKLSKRKTRMESGLFLVESEHLVKEAYDAGILKEVISVREVSYNVPCHVVSMEVMRKISNLESTPQVMGVVYMQRSEVIRGNVLLLDSVQDPGNLGTLIRSAVAFGVESIVLGVGCVDAYNDKVIRASEGMIFKVNIVSGDLEEIILRLKDDGYVVYGTDVTQGLEGRCVKVEGKWGLVIGNEGVGVSKEVLYLCDKNLYISMSSLCESLNASVAGSILMYELSRSD